MKNWLITTKILPTLLLVLIAFSIAAPAMARPNIGLQFAENIGLAQASDDDIRDTVVNIIRYLITFLGLVAVAIILYGGFIWMTAAGNEDRVGKAKKIIIAGVIGLIVILSAFAIVNFVLDITDDALNGDI